MLKKTIKFVDYNGVERTENLYFHVSKTSVLTSKDDIYNEIMGIASGLQDQAKLLEGIKEDQVNNENPFDPNNKIIADSARMVARLLDRLIDLSYGKRSEDGQKFAKSKEILDEFKSSAAYEAFIEHMISNQEEMIEFINKLVSM